MATAKAKLSRTSARRKLPAKKSKQLERKPNPWQVAGTLFSDPNAVIWTGKVDGKHERMDALPFVKTREKGGFDCWAVEPTGDYERDCQIGHEYARMLLPRLRYNGGISELGWIVTSMIERGEAKRDRGLVVGFMSALSLELSRRRHELAYFALAAAPPGKFRNRKTVDWLKKVTAKAAVPTVLELGRSAI